MLDLAIRGGVIVDGTGAPRFSGDVGVKDGRIAAIGGDVGRATEEIKAGGAVISPGFIDCHTHYDAQIAWDAMLSPSVYHGVTTVLAGNCGFTLAPLSGRKEDFDYLLGMLSVVEGMPISTLETAVKPGWTSFGGFLDAVDGTCAINTAFMAGHSAIRRAVMGERAVGFEASEAELAAMVALLRQSLAEGAVGFSTSTSETHSDHNGDMVPSRFASEAELIALSGALRDYPGTWLEIVLGLGAYDGIYAERVAQMSLAAQRPINWNALFPSPHYAAIIDSQLAMNQAAAKRGAKAFGLCPGGPIGGYTNFRTGFTLSMIPGWKEFILLPDAEKIAAMHDPSLRERLKAGLRHPDCTVRALRDIDSHRIESVRTAANKPWQGRTMGEFAAARAKDPFDALFDLAIEEELDVIVTPPKMGDDEESWLLRERVWRDESVLIGASDAGAHLDLIDTFAITTQFLGGGVRERGIYSLEQGVRRMTGELAAAFGLKNRGQIALGACADLVVFDPDTIACGPVAMRRDLPGGEMRLYADAVGVSHVITNGVPVAANNAPTGRLGGRVLRSGRDTETVSLH